MTAKAKSAAAIRTASRSYPKGVEVAMLAPSGPSALSELSEGKVYEQAVGTATHYHAFYVHPNWVREMKKLVRYSEHSFYRPFAWGNGFDEPVGSILALKKKLTTTR